MKTKYAWGRLVIKDRRTNKQQKECKSLKSILETTEVDGLVEAGEIVQYDFAQPGPSLREIEGSEINRALGFDKISNEFDMTCNNFDISKTQIRTNLLTIPLKPQPGLAREEYKNEERKLFNQWKLQMNGLLRQAGVLTPYERNLNVWRQLWFTLERSDIIVQIVDARNPLVYYTPDIAKLSPEKQHVLLLNKSDLLSPAQKQAWHVYWQAQGITHLFYSSKTGCIDWVDWIGLNGEELRGSTEDGDLLKGLGSQGKCVGMIGYPNVGKSSTINAIFKKKVVQTSLVPGKTKSIQTLNIGEVTLCDCPGLVFPSLVAHKQDLVLNGILALDHTRDIRGCLEVIVERLGVRTLCYLLGVRCFINDSRRSLADNFMDALKRTTGCQEEGKLVKGLVKDYLEGRIKYVHAPPGLCPVKFNEDSNGVPDEFVVDTTPNHDWYAEAQKKPEAKLSAEDLLYSKKHYLKKGLTRRFQNY
ncbi:large subunit GTPase 1 [Nematocida homosporus]|uniref:large subunit GTPase 1 n=1 Tax=Nematocida homosporus TaxID=1912981 RepID=UPI00221E8AA5|nr:large subunit GTPase 1 [Nematocida homosporus]KAI5185126.1 large subunit GTPase 1 [Nematocida homosporus]